MVKNEPFRGEIMEQKNIERAVEFFRSMSEKNKAEAPTGSDYQDGHVAGAAIAWSVAAEYLESILKWEEGK